MRKQRNEASSITRVMMKKCPRMTKASNSRDQPVWIKTEQWKDPFRGGVEGGKNY